jgi:hypothetical protein
MKIRLILIFLMLGDGIILAATTYHSNGTAQNIQQIHDTKAVDGDTITLPIGTFRWTVPVNISKAITLRGATSIAGAGTAKPTVADATIVQDNIPRGTTYKYIFRASLNANQTGRLSRITFTSGNVCPPPPASCTLGIDGAFILNGNDTAGPSHFRIDNCHFDQLYIGKIIWVSGWMDGVADHNYIVYRGRQTAFNIQQRSYGGHPGDVQGNGSWADYPWYGTGKFFFFETNTIIGLTVGAAAPVVDTQHGGRWVGRYNYLKNTFPNGHGTEGGAHRGQRVSEFYGNTINMTVPWTGFGQRSGTSMYHDNRFTGIESTSQAICALANYRETPARAFPVWGIADGTSVWDQNDTDGNGHYVEGDPPHLFDSGRDTSSVNSRGVIRDSTKHWTLNQWIGYSIKNTNPASASYTLGSYVISNTSNTITYYYYGAPDTRAHLIFNAGDTYQIHRVLVMMDQNGRGKGDLVKDNPNPVNTATGRRSWPHQALEPCYSWNNVHLPSNHAYGFRVPVGQPTTKKGVDFFNLGNGFLPHITPQAVSNRYRAALNGVDYVRTYRYPHPLVSE